VQSESLLFHQRGIRWNIPDDRTGMEIARPDVPIGCVGRQRNSLAHHREYSHLEAGEIEP